MSFITYSNRKIILIFLIFISFISLTCASLSANDNKSLSYSSESLCNTDVEINNIAFPKYSRSECYELDGKYYYNICNKGVTCTSGEYQEEGGVTEGNPYKQHLSNKLNTKNDRFILKLTKLKDDIGDERFKKLLELLVTKLENLEEKYSSEEEVVMIIKSLTWEVNNITLGSNIDDFYCDLMGGCSDSTTTSDSVDQEELWYYKINWNTYNENCTGEILDTIKGGVSGWKFISEDICNEYLNDALADNSCKLRSYENYYYKYTDGSCESFYQDAGWCDNNKSVCKTEDGKDEDGKDEDGKDEDGKDEDGKDEDGEDEDGEDEDGKDEDGEDEDGEDEDGEDEGAECGLNNNGIGFTTSSVTEQRACEAGTMQNLDSSDDLTFSWKCSDGLETVNCEATKKADCGESDGEVFSDQPTEDLCTVGSSSGISVTSSGWSWKCNGNTTSIYPTNSDYCSANITPYATCGSATKEEKVTWDEFESSYGHRLCNYENDSDGIIEVDTNGDDGDFNWICKGFEDIEINCSADKKASGDELCNGDGSFLTQSGIEVTSNVPTSNYPIYSWTYDSDLSSKCSYRCEIGYKPTHQVSGYRGSSKCMPKNECEDDEYFNSDWEEYDSQATANKACSNCKGTSPGSNTYNSSTSRPSLRENDDNNTWKFIDTSNMNNSETVAILAESCTRTCKAGYERSSISSSSCTIIDNNTTTYPTLITLDCEDDSTAADWYKNYAKRCGEEGGLDFRNGASDSYTAFKQDVDDGCSNYDSMNACMSFKLCNPGDTYIENTNNCKQN